MRYRQAYSLYPRKAKKGRVYYYRTYDENGRRTPGCSTGMRSREAAKAFCDELLVSGRLMPDPKERPIKFDQFAKDWWLWDECPYVKIRRARGTPTRPGIKQSTVSKNRELLELYILPYFGKMTLRSITKADVEEWLVWLCSLVSNRTKRPLAPKTVNNIRSVLLLMLKEAEQNGVIKSNPVVNTLPMLVDERPRKLLSVAEVLTLLDPGRIDTLWNGNQYYYVANLLTAVTGMREGEIRALQPHQVHDTFIAVANSYDSVHGLTTTKGSYVREIPLSPQVMAMLRELVWKMKPGSKYIFSIRGGSPIAASKCTESLYSAMKKIGIDKEERKRRNLTYHAWRHWFTTECVKENLNPAKIRAMVGHKSEKMTQLYTDLGVSDLTEISSLQASLSDTLLGSFSETFSNDTRIGGSKRRGRRMSHD